MAQKRATETLNAMSDPARSRASPVTRNDGMTRAADPMSDQLIAFLPAFEAAFAKTTMTMIRISRCSTPVSRTIGFCPAFTN